MARCQGSLSDVVPLYVTYGAPACAHLHLLICELSSDVRSSQDEEPDEDEMAEDSALLINRGTAGQQVSHYYVEKLNQEHASR